MCLLNIQFSTSVFEWMSMGLSSDVVGHKMSCHHSILAVEISLLTPVEPGWKCAPSLIFNSSSIWKVCFFRVGSFLYVVPYFMNASFVVVPPWGCGCSGDACLSSVSCVSISPPTQVAWCCGGDGSQGLVCNIQNTEGNSVELLLKVLTYN